MKKSTLKLMIGLNVILLIIVLSLLLIEYNPQRIFRDSVVEILNSRIDVPEQYDYYIYKRHVGGEYSHDISVLHIEWKDENGFNYSFDVEQLYHIDKIIYSITKTVDYQFTFKDYIPNNYFNYGDGFSFEYNNYLKEEPQLINQIKEDIMSVAPKIGTLKLEYLAIPSVTMESSIPGQTIGKEFLLIKKKVDAVTVISKYQGKYKYEYDYNGDGLLDEVKLFDQFQDPSDIIVELSNNLNSDYSYSHEYAKDLRTSLKFVNEKGEDITVVLDEDSGEMKIWVGFFIQNNS